MTLLKLLVQEYWISLARDDVRATLIRAFVDPSQSVNSVNSKLIEAGFKLPH